MNTYFAVATLPESQIRLISGVDNETAVQAGEQTVTRPKIDDIVCHCLDGDTLKDALFIIDNIREHNMKIKWSSINTWSVQYKRKHVCDLRIENSSLRIGHVNDILATRVTKMSHDPERMQRLIETLRDSMTGTQKPVHALQ